MLGGGLIDFVRKDRDLTKEFQKAGYRYVTNKADLQKNKQQKLLGIFADGGLDKAIDRDKMTPSLQDMTSSAIKQLSKNKKDFSSWLKAVKLTGLDMTTILSVR